MNYCRTDLCPDCGTRLRNIHNQHDPSWDHVIVGDYPIYTKYKGNIHKTIVCWNGCRKVWAKEAVYDYWAEQLELLLELS